MLHVSCCTFVLLLHFRVTLDLSGFRGLWEVSVFSTPALFFRCALANQKYPQYPKHLLRLFFRNSLTRLKITSEVKNNLKMLILTLF